MLSREGPGPFYRRGVGGNRNEQGHGRKEREDAGKEGIGVREEGREEERRMGGGEQAIALQSSTNSSGTLTVLGLDGGAAHSSETCWVAYKLSTKEK